MQISCSGVMMQSEFLWPVLGSASMTSVHRFRFTVPWGKVLGWRTIKAPQLLLGELTRVEAGYETELTELR